MILCLIILTVSVLMIVAGAIIASKTSKRWDMALLETFGIASIVFGIVAFFVAGVLLIVVPIECHAELDIFLHQKEYIENYVPTSEYDTAAIINQKIELNQWLYEKQYTKEHYPICSFFGDEILELEPIK